MILCLTALPVRGEEEAEIRRLLAQAGGKDRWGDAAQVILYDRTWNRCEENGRSTRTQEVLAKILKPQGARERSVLVLGYDPKTNKVAFLRVRVFKADGRTLQIPLDPLDLPNPGGIIFWEGRRKILAVPGLEVGDGIEIVTQSVGFKIAYLKDDEEDRYVPPMRGHFYDVVPFWTSVPVGEKKYVLQAPRTKAIQFRVYNGALETALRTEADASIYAFTARDMKPFEGEDGMVSRWDVAPKLVLASVPDWPTKSRWFYQVNEPQFEVDDAIRKKVAEITKSCKTDEEKIKALVHWVADEVRYLGLCMGKGEGYTTHPSIMTFRERAGVCKDKAGLLVSMLRVAGFESFIAMTQVGSRVEAVAADQFNHAVTAMRLSDGRFLMLDPTWAPASCEMWSSLEQRQYFVIGTKAGEGLERAPYFSPEDNRINVLSRVTLRPRPGGADLVGECVMEARGYPDTFLRRTIQRTPAGKARRFFEGLLETIAPGTALRELEVSEITDYSQPMRVVMRWRSTNATMAGADRIVLGPPLLRMMKRFPLVERFLSAANPEKRKYPFNLRNTLGIGFREEIDAPEGFAWHHPWRGKAVDMVETEAIAARDGTRYAAFTFAKKPLGTKIILEGDLRIPHKEVPAEVHPDFRRVMKEVRKAMEHRLELRKK
jgi:hypothetical protein